jgi:antitoxin ParD1/3/4/toxin ParE1/3/4
MNDYQLSPDALQDLKDVWDFIHSDSAEAADQVVDAIFTACEGLAAMSYKGHKREDLTSSAVRFWPVYSYHVIYRPKTIPLQIVGIVHGSRDVPEVLREKGL